jgi:hypothetical protein
MNNPRHQRIDRMRQQAEASQWVPIAVLTARLSKSAKTIKRRRDEGVFRIGIHYRIVGSPHALRPDYLYHLSRCAKALGIPLD